MTRVDTMMRVALGAWLRFASLCALALAVQAVCAAQAAAQMVVLRIDPAAEEMSQQLEAALSPFGLVPDPGYFAEAQRQGLDPSSDQALGMLTPPAGAQLAVVPRGSDGRSVLVEFRDGRSGASLGTASLPLKRDGALGPAGQRKLADEVNARLGAGQPSAEGSAGSGTASTGDGDGSSARGDGDDESDASAAAAEPSESGEGTALRLRAFGGFGVGTRNLEWPAAGETRALESGAFLAVEAGAAFAIELDDGLALGPELTYQTSLDHEIEETHVAGAADTLGLRAHRFSAVLELAIGSDDGVRVSPGLGYGVRALHPEVHHLLTPSYSLTGPIARIALRIAFGASVALRLVPEVQLISVGDALQELGVSGSGVSFGGDAALELVLSRGLSLELSYREAHALMSAEMGDSASDVERFITARGVWRP